MKTRFAVYTFLSLILLIPSCEKGSKIELADVLDLSISTNENVLIKGSPLIMSIQVKNTSNYVFVTESGFRLEFASDNFYATLPVSMFEETGSSGLTQQVRMEFDGNETLVNSFDLEKIIWKSTDSSTDVLPEGNYSVTLILETVPDPMSPRIEEDIISNPINIDICYF